jgi:hypothetical protein
VAEEELEEEGFIFAIEQDDEEPEKPSASGTAGTSTLPAEEPSASGSASSTVAVLLDSAAAVSVCPVDFAPAAATERSSGMRLRTASGEDIKHYGKKTVPMQEAESGANIKGVFDVREVKKPIIAASSLTAGGSGVWLCSGGGYVVSRTQAAEIGQWLHDNLAVGERLAVHQRKGVFEMDILVKDVGGLGPSAPRGNEAERRPTARQAPGVLSLSGLPRAVQRE